MSTTQPYKIQIKQGLAVDLPGAPLVGSTQPALGLSTGEFGFSIDTGDLFIGSDPQHPLFTTSRVQQYPYANIRVLTESVASLAFINSVIATNHTNFNSAILPQLSSGPIGTTDLVWLSAQSNAVEIRYMLCFENLPSAIRKGTLSMVMNQSAINIVDNNIDVGFDGLNYVNPDAFADNTVFSFGTTIANGLATLTYTNNSAYTAKLYYSVVNFNAQF